MHHSTWTEPPSPRDLPSTPLPTAPPPVNSKNRSRCRCMRQRSQHRAIYQWLGARPLSEEHPSEANIVEALERIVSAEGGSVPHIQGVLWTPAGHLAIHTQPPFLATQLAPLFPRLDLVIKGRFKSYGEKCILDVDTPWTWVVLHGVPAKAFWEVMDNENQDMWTELTSQGYGEEVLTYHPMVKSGQS
ncbi:hypothetical protein K438DRAFT_1755380 [Mycena galopus ATCC 62051]|nr:hypothetical protein K438DRAFT_1755380 [Mycena galopus ATCC 62051]